MIEVRFKAEANRNYQLESHTFNMTLATRPVLEDRIEVDFPHSINHYRVICITFDMKGNLIASVELINKLRK